MVPSLFHLPSGISAIFYDQNGRLTNFPEAGGSAKIRCSCSKPCPPDSRIALFEEETGEIVSSAPCDDGEEGLTLSWIMAIEHCPLHRSFSCRIGHENLLSRAVKVTCGYGFINETTPTSVTEPSPIKSKLKCWFRSAASQSGSPRYSAYLRLSPALSNCIFGFFQNRCVPSRYLTRLSNVRVSILTSV